MKKGSKKLIIFSIILSIAIIISIIGCHSILTRPRTYPFLHDLSEIEEIQIIKITIPEHEEYFGSVFENDLEIIACIEDKESFLIKFQNEVLFSRQIAGPTFLYKDDYAIKVTYIGGDFELIGYRAQCIFEQAANTQIYGTGGHYGCPEKDFICFLFEEMINLYATKLDLS